MGDADGPPPVPSSSASVAIARAKRTTIFMCFCYEGDFRVRLQGEPLGLPLRLSGRGPRPVRPEPGQAWEGPPPGVQDQAGEPGCRRVLAGPGPDAELHFPRVTVQGEDEDLALYSSEQGRITQARLPEPGRAARNMQAERRSASRLSGSSPR